MKKIFLALGIAATFNLSAQFTITSSMAPVAGDVDGSMVTQTVGLTAPATGTNKFWNYTGVLINSTATPQSSTYTPVSAAPNANLYPGATLAATEDNVEYSMLKITNTSHEELGTAAPTLSDCVVYNNPFSLYTYPFSYGNTFSDTYGYSAPSNTVTGAVTTTANGTGTLAIPGFTFSNVLMTTSDITQSQNTGTMTTTAKLRMYGFFSGASKFPLFTISNYTLSIPGFTITEISGLINSSFIITGITDHTETDGLSLYPNPSTAGILYVKNTNSKPFSLEIYSTTGALVKTAIICESATGVVNTENLAPGIYILKLANKETAVTKKLIIE